MNHISCAFHEGRVLSMSKIKCLGRVILTEWSFQVGNVVVVVVGEPR